MSDNYESSWEKKLAAAEGRANELEDACAALVRERDETKKQLLAVHAYLADGEIRGAVGGGMAKVFALSLIEFYRASGGANYVEMGIADTKNGERFTVLIQRVEGKSPHELRAVAEERARKLEEALRSIADERCCCFEPQDAERLGHDGHCPLSQGAVQSARAALNPPPEAEKKGGETNGR